MPTKKKLGIIGGMGSRAGAMLFDKIVDRSPAVRDQEFIEVLLHSNSAIPDRTEAIVYDAPSPVEEILRSIRIFDANEVEVVVMACITSYHFIEQIRPFTKAEIINPVSLVREYIFRHHSQIKRVGLLATTGTLKSGLFQNEFKDTGIDIITLNARDQEGIFMRSVYMKNGLKSSIISEEAVNLFQKAVPKLIEQGAELIIGGCTEVQLILNKDIGTLPYIDTMDIAAREIVSKCYNMKELAVEI